MHRAAKTINPKKEKSSGIDETQGKSLLTAYDPMLDQEVVKEDEAAEKAWQLLCENALEGYRAGEIQFEPFCRQCDKVLGALTLSEGFRRKILGQIVHRAIEGAAPPKRSRGNRGRPAWERKTAAGLVAMVVDSEGLARDREPGQAYERVSGLLGSFGIHATTRQVEQWDQDARRVNTK